MARSSVLPHRQVVQAKALLALADGRSVRATAKELRTYPNTVTAWRDRFIEIGVEGVGAIAPGRGRKPEILTSRVEAIVHDTLHTVPEDGSTCWSTRTLAVRHGVGKDTVQRIWKARNLRPWQVDTFKLSTDPLFEAKLVDVVGLYLDPPERAMVFSFDEKTQCQALDRTQPSLPMKPGRGRTMTHDYKRNGTVDLFAAMNNGFGKRRVRLGTRAVIALQLVCTLPRSFRRCVTPTLTPTPEQPVTVFRFGSRWCSRCAREWFRVRRGPWQVGLLGDGEGREQHVRSAPVRSPAVRVRAPSGCRSVGGPVRILLRRPRRSRPDLIRLRRHLRTRRGSGARSRPRGRCARRTASARGATETAVGRGRAPNRRPG